MIIGFELYRFFFSKLNAFLKVVKINIDSKFGAYATFRSAILQP